MNELKKLEFWFLTGSQDLYGEEPLKLVARDSQKIVDELNASGRLPFTLVNKPVQKSPLQIRATIEQAGADSRCGGVVCWMHTFSPAKMWISGLSVLSKPLLQLHTQFNERIPFDTIDMDFMNLNQSAHGDREFGHITARMDLPRTVITGHWSHKVTQSRIARWMRSASAVAEGRDLIIARFGDNMRDVAVTDGDKVEAMIKLGWSVPYYGIGDLVAYRNDVAESDVDALIEEYRSLYTFTYSVSEEAFLRQTREQARVEIALERFLKDVGARAFCTNFQDLHGMSQLPGLAAQRLMAKGYGFAGEGDWKTAAMVRLFKVMGAGLPGGASFMEDYTYHLEEGAMLDLGAHMLEICPSLAQGKPTLEVHPLGIGDKEDPARLVFDGRPGNALCAAIVDMGNRFRIVVSEVESIQTPEAFQRLPVARVLWKPLPDLVTASEAWILAGGGHHTAYSDSIDTEYLRTFAEMTGIECVDIGKDTTIGQFRKELRWNSGYWG
ncbi:MAG TPA: L-arabinose isomerase [Sphaerochaetaceae bacterium]|nr:L-arabinose isomerase [Sphaerochaetaceae bacterium]